MNSSDILKKIRSVANFTPIQDGHDSYYAVNYRHNRKTIQVRISNHGTYCRTWVDMTNKSHSETRLNDPSSCINISIVFLDEGRPLTDDCEGQTNCDNCQIECIPSVIKGINAKGRSFEILQYVYQSRFINNHYLDSIKNAVERAINGGRYIDPLRNSDNRKASPLRMMPQEPISRDNRLNCNRNMKQMIRLTESTLRGMIQEAVAEALNGNDGIEDVEFNPRNGYLSWFYNGKEYWAQGEFYIDKNGILHHTFFTPEEEEKEVSIKVW